MQAATAQVGMRASALAAASPGSRCLVHGAKRLLGRELKDCADVAKLSYAVRGTEAESRGCNAGLLLSSRVSAVVLAADRAAVAAGGGLARLVASLLPQGGGEAAAGATAVAASVEGVGGVTPVEVSAAVLMQLKSTAEAHPSAHK